MKKIFTLALACGAMFSANADWIVNQSWDFADLQTKYDNKTAVPYSDDTQSFGGTACNLGTDWADGLAFQGASGWFLYTSGGLYQGNGGGRRCAVLEVYVGDRVTIKTNTTSESTLYNATGADLYNYSEGTYEYDCTVNGSFYFDLTRYYTIYSIEVATYVSDGTETYADYTVKYVDQDGNEIKEDATRNGIVGDAAVLLGSDTADFWADDDTKWIYVDNDLEEGQTIQEDLVITCTFRPANTFTYTVATSNPDNEAYATGSIIEGETDYVYFPAYFLTDGKLTTTPALSNEYRLTITPSADYEYTINYTDVTFEADEDSEFTPVCILYAEGEDIEGMTSSNGTNANIRCSMGLGGWPQDGNVTITTLPAGKYQLIVSTRGGGNRDYGYQFYLGEQPEGEAENESILWLTAPLYGYNQTTTSDVIELTEATDLWLAQAGSSNDLVDYIYIVQTGEYTNESSDDDNDDNEGGEGSWIVNQCWDFADLQTKYDNKTAVPYSADTQSFGGVDCNLGTDWAEGLAFQGASGWFLYTSGGLYQGNGGGRICAILEVSEGDRITIKTNTTEESTLYNATGADLDNYDGGTYVYDCTADGSFYFYLTRYYTIYSIEVATYVLDGDGDDDTSGISGISADTEIKNTRIYNLQGIEMRSDNLPAGIYIQGGKKFIVR